MPAKARLVVRRPDFSILSIEESPLLFECSRTENSVGAFSASMPMRPDYDQISADYMLELQRSFDGGRTYKNDTKTLWLARSVTLSINERGKETIEMTGTDLLGLLDRRIIAWFAVSATDIGQDYYSCKTKPACDMMRAIVRENFTSLATQGEPNVPDESGMVLVVGGKTIGDAVLSTCETYDASSGQWEASPSTSWARYNHAMAALANGKEFMVAGGQNDGDFPLTSVDIYQMSTDTWRQAASMNNARTSFTLTTLSNGKILAVGGRAVGEVYLSSVELYDASLDTWTNMNDVPWDRAHHTATLLNDGRVLVTGGYNSDDDLEGTIYLDNASVFDPATGLWTIVATMNYSLAYHTATLLRSGEVLVVGGRDEHIVRPNGSLYNPTTNEWSSAGAMSGGRYHHTATTLSDGRVLVVGGEDGSNVLATVDIYDPDTNTWSATGSLGISRRLHTATKTNDGKVLVTGGRTSGNIPLYTAELYDPDTGLWSIAESMSEQRAYHAAIFLPVRSMDYGDYPGSVHAPGLATEADRVMPFMSVEEDHADGPVITQEFAWQVVGDVLRQISDAAYAENNRRIVFDIEWNPQLNPPMRFIAKEGAIGVDRTSSILFSIAAGNITELKMKMDRTTEATWIHVGGKGNSDLRVVQPVVDTVNNKKTPFYPIEAFVEKADSADEEVLRKAGDVEMRRRRARWIFTGMARDINGCVFGVDYGYGDLVRAAHRGQAATCRISTFRLRYEAGRETVELPLSSEDESV
jgi:N-acetylneuraminic acid mutarotase